MNKRVHEIAKERGVPSRAILERLRAAGVDVKAASSSVDEELALRVLDGGTQDGDRDGAAETAAQQRAGDQGQQEAARPQPPVASERVGDVGLSGNRAQGAGKPARPEAGAGATGPQPQV